MIALAIFDLAGTTVRDDGQVVRAFRAALSDHGIEIGEEAVAGVRGASKRQAIEGLIPDGPDRHSRADRVYASFRARLAEEFERVPALPADGAEEIFRDLRSAGVRVALNTGFDREITDRLLDSLGWREGRVDAIVCGDDVARGRPAPDLIFKAMAETGMSDPARVGAVGDTALDLEAGDNAGVGWNVAVCGGAHERERLERAPHTHIVDSLRALGAIWEVRKGEGGRTARLPETEERKIRR